MGDPDPRRAVIKHLTLPPVGQPPPRQAPQTGEPPVRAVASGRRGNPFTADSASIQFVKERGNASRQLFAVTFEDQHHNRWFFLVAAENDPTNDWIAHGVAGGSGEIPQRSQPWLNFAGGWGQRGLYAGGQIHAAGATIDEVRLFLDDGTYLTDDASCGVALFVTDQPREPVSVSIYGTDGQLLADHGLF